MGMFFGQPMDSYRITNPAGIQDIPLDSNEGIWCEGNWSAVHGGHH